MEKSKRNKHSIIVIGYWILIIGLLVYSRFVNLGWGLPYPMHPDERNMAIAVQGLNCEISNFKFQISNFRECGNPHFFAYGQFPLYLSYFFGLIKKFFTGDLRTAIRFSEAIISLRIISAVASVVTVFIILKIINYITKERSLAILVMSWGVIIFSPFAIQFAHFGTTESLLMLFYSLVILYSLKFLDGKIFNIQYIILTALFSGLTVATKVSSIIFLAVPIVVFISKIKNHSFVKGITILLSFTVCTLLFTLIFSPHNFINWWEFISTIRYESDVALGKKLVFYTRQFIGTVPILFQLIKIFPYALGWPMLVLALLGILSLSWRDRKINLLRMALLIYFLVNAFLFAKWTRFMAPIFPLMLIFGLLFIIKARVINIIKTLIILIAILPGIAYISIYHSPDVRFTASAWIYNNIPVDSYILSETANVVDIPLPINRDKNYKVISFDFYELDSNHRLQQELKQHLQLADYIIIPSRRIFFNHPKKMYPRVSNYYDLLLSGKLGFKPIIQFNSYPKISLFGNILLEFPDEKAEETWTVFDHPVVRIFKRIGKTL